MPNEMDIPGLLLEKLEIDREGTFALPEGADVITPRAAVALGDDLALVGDAQAGHSRRWVGLAPIKGPTRGTMLDAGTIRAAISDGKGGALLIGADGDARPWFGALNARGVVSSNKLLDSDEPINLTDVLAGLGNDEHALLLGNLAAHDGGAHGWLGSIDARARIQQQLQLTDLGAARIQSGARIPGEANEVLVVGAQLDDGSAAWWARLGATEVRAHGKVEIEDADPIRTLDAIVPLDHEMGFIALGRARREAEQDHEQAIAVGFDPSGAPTWTRVLDHFRAIEIYGGTVHERVRGVVHFVARIPIDRAGNTALAWIEICPGVDGALVTRQIAGTAGWQSAGFVEGREDGAILAYSRTDSGMDWRILLVNVGGHLWG